MRIVHIVIAAEVWPTVWQHRRSIVELPHLSLWLACAGQLSHEREVACRAFVPVPALGGKGRHTLPLPLQCAGHSKQLAQHSAHIVAVRLAEPGDVFNARTARSGFAGDERRRAAGHCLLHD